MSFLSLGISKDEQQDDQQVTVAGQSLASQPKNPVADSSLLKKPIPANDVSSQNDAELSNLPPAVEELRRKLSGNGYRPTFRAVSDGIPTFGTFKFGYVPARGLLYSVIAAL